MEEEFIRNQERLKPQEEKNEVSTYSSLTIESLSPFYQALCAVDQ